MTGTMSGRAPSRTVVAAMLLVAALAALLVAWFLSGWADVRAQQREVGAAPARAAVERGGELAAELRGELARLMTREVERPYFHYQNLMHDPRSGGTLNVSPSPLASGPADALVLGYFQLDAEGAVSTPPINDEIPSLSEPRNYAGNQRFRGEVARNFTVSLKPPPVVAARGTLVASAGPVAGERPRRSPAPAVVARAEVARPVVTNERMPAPPSTVGQAQVQLPPPPQVPAVPQAPPEPQQVQQAPVQQAQVFQLDENSYAQNSMTSEVYRQQNAPGPQRSTPRRKVKRSKPVEDLPQQSQSPAPRQAQVQQAPPPQVVAPPPQIAPPPAPSSDPTGRGRALSDLQQQQRSVPGTAANATGAAPAAGKPPGETVGKPASETPGTPAEPVKPPPVRRVARPVPPPAAAAEVVEPAKPITITISPLEWRTLPYEGKPALVAVRHVETPDANLAQGFVVDRASLTSWLASRSGDAVAELKTGASAHAAEVAPGWYLDVAANPRALVEAAAEASHIATGFLLRFVIVGVIAMLAAGLVVMLVSRAERLARERSQFAAAAAHELRTPLAGLQLYGDMLADGLGDPAKMRDYARRMSEEASRLGRVVSNVLGFSQLERGNLSVEARTGNLGAALCELAERAQPALDRAGAVLALDVPPELTARYDRDALARIVGNLLDNAEKYGREAEDRTIDLAARDTGAHVEVIVTDRGPGVPAAARGKLFRPFSRGVTGDGPAGLGLGLALSQSLARAMGGDLELRAAPERGASFVLRLAKPS